MTAALASPIRGALRRAVRRLVGGAVVLIYHRVTTLPSDPQLLAVTPERFDQQMRVLNETCRVLPLSELAGELARGRAVRNAVVVTFDDGYADNLHEGKPILEAYHTPATVFVASGAIGSDREFYWDELEAILLQPGVLPGTLELSIDGAIHRWHFDADATLRPAAFEQRRRWSVAEAPAHPRQAAYKAICALLRPLPPAAQRSAMDRMREWAGYNAAQRATHRTLDAAELRALAQAELIEIGAHTVDHAYLSSLPASEQRRQIIQSKADLESITGQPVTTFSYPYGTKASYAGTDAAWLRDAGLSCACANFAGTARPKSDLFELPRVLVRDWDGDVFARHLRSWLDG